MQQSARKLDLDQYLFSTPMTLDWLQGTPVFTSQWGIDHPEFLDITPDTRIKPLGAHAAGFIKYNYPRGIKYHDYPIISDARFCFRMENRAQHSSASNLNSLDALHHAMKNSEFLVYDEATSGRSVRDRFMTSALHGLLCSDKPIYRRFADETEFTKTTSEALGAEQKTWSRLDYSYRINYHAIGNIALQRVKPFIQGIVIPDTANRPTKQWLLGLAAARHSLGNLDEISFQSGELSYVQFLFGVRDLDREQSEKWYENVVREDTLTPKRRVGIGRYISEDGKSWVGTGKYAPIPLPSDWYDFVDYALIDGFIELSCDKRTLKISDAGKRLLDLFHPDNEDPDILLRFGNQTWEKYETVIADSKQEAADNWVGRFFRKFKTRVNASR